MAKIVPARFLRPARTSFAGRRVAIVGAGPGDPELLTVKACRRLASADVVVYDRLVGAGVLDLVRPGARRVYVGKAPGNHSLSQDEINALLAHEAVAGRRVVRLKGGDPFVFGRGGEEVAYLTGLGIEVELIPGVTAATGCAAALGLPLTHRDYASALTVVSGHGAGDGLDLDWRALAAAHQTVVIYMGVANAATIARRLIEHGLAPTTPVAVVENGTLPQQRSLFGTLSGLGALVADNAVHAPALIVIGEVVRLAAAQVRQATQPLPDVAVG